MYVQSKRTDEPPHDDQISSVYWFKRLTDRCDRVNNPQQSEGRPCRDEPRSQEADAGAFPQHEQVGGHQWAADEVRFFFFFRVLVLDLRWKGAESGGSWSVWWVVLCSFFRGANLSESEAEQDGEHNITELPQVYSGRGNMASQQSAVRLTEVSVLTKCNFLF